MKKFYQKLFLKNKIRLGPPAKHEMSFDDWIHFHREIEDLKAAQFNLESRLKKLETLPALPSLQSLYENHTH